MSERPPKAIRSLREDDPAVEERIDTFIAGLGERIDRLQDLEAGGDPNALRDGVLAFAAEALELGYPALAETARRVATACDEGSAEAMRKGVLDLTDVSQRVRRGHRSAA